VKFSPIQTRPSVLFTGDTDHVDFRDAADLLRTGTNLATANAPPELIVVAHSRPGSVSFEQLESLRRTSPLAGVLVLAGTWCEGEPRTGRPWPGVHRLYWYEFPAWWRRQLARRAAGRCPDWARPEGLHFAAFPALGNSTPRQSGIVLLKTHDAATSDALADVLHRAGYASVRPAVSSTRSIRGASAAIWDGGQLSEFEQRELSRLCAELPTDRTPIVALLDFPRRDRVERALEIGASAVLGKPWVNANLLATIEAIAPRTSRPIAA
jgi:hypothetical protein